MVGTARQSAPVFDVTAVQHVGGRYVEEVRSVKEFVELLAVSALVPKIYVTTGASPEQFLRLYEDAEAFASAVEEPPKPVGTHTAFLRGIELNIGDPRFCCLTVSDRQFRSVGSWPLSMR